MKKYFLYLLVVFAICSCTKDLSTGNPSEEIEDKVDSIEASISAIKDSGDKNKNVQKVWCEGDFISVVGPKTNKSYKFDGSASKRSGTFTYTVSQPLLDYKFDNYYAVSQGGKFELSPYGTLYCYSPSEGTSIQKYSPNIDDKELMFATSKDGKSFTFSSIIGYLRVPLSGDNVVKNIELINNTGVFISGRYYFDATRPNNGVSWDSNSERKKSIILDCGEGVQLTDISTDFYFAIKPMELSKGITLNITFADGSSYIHKTSDPTTIASNTVQPITTVYTASGDSQVVGMKFSGSDLLIPTFTGGDNLSGFIKFGDGETRVLNVTTHYIYTDEQESHDITFNLRNATSMNIENCEGITELDLSNF